MARAGPRPPGTRGTRDAFRQLAFKILAIEGQIVDRDEVEGQFFRSKVSERWGELAVDGIAPVAADENDDLDLYHCRRTLVMI
ncbi:MAG: hypothetical protein WBD78_00980 [Methylocella sp.]